VRAWRCAARRRRALDGPIAADTDTFGRTHLAAGGQAANVAAWVVALGGRGRAIATRARDAAGRLVADELASRGVDVDTAWLAGCDWLHVSGYCLVSAPLADAALAAARLVEHVSLDVSSTAAVAAVGADEFRRLLAELSPAVVFATEDEASLVQPVDASTLVVKRGARGCVVRTRDGDAEHAARAAAVVDTTGAGDAFAAGFLLEGAEFALEAAARCVSRIGAMPP
jgi:ribokinase